MTRANTRSVAAALLVAAICALAVALDARGAGADPAINENFEHPDFATWVARFERPGREVYDRRMAIVDALGLHAGMNVADVGAGTGLFTLLFAPRVAPGTVYAVDIAPEFVAGVRARATAAGFGNVVGVVNAQDGAGIAAGSVDLVFVCDTYHHFEQPAVMLQSLFAALRPGGSLVVVDYRRDRGSGWVTSHVRAGESGVIGEIEAAGFRFAGEGAVLRENYFIRFERP